MTVRPKRRQCGASTAEWCGGALTGLHSGFEPDRLHFLPPLSWRWPTALHLHELYLILPSCPPALRRQAGADEPRGRDRCRGCQEGGDHGIMLHSLDGVLDLKQDQGEGISGGASAEGPPSRHTKSWHS